MLRVFSTKYKPVKTLVAIIEVTTGRGMKVTDKRTKTLYDSPRDSKLLDKSPEEVAKQVFKLESNEKLVKAKWQ